MLLLFIEQQQLQRRSRQVQKIRPFCRPPELATFEIEPPLYAAL
jgi:hypothetical protein